VTKFLFSWCSKIHKNLPMIAILCQINSDYMTLVTRCCLLHDRQWQWCASQLRYTGILKYSNWVKVVRCEWNSTPCRVPLHNLLNTVTLINTSWLKHMMWYSSIFRLPLTESKQFIAWSLKSAIAVTGGVHLSSLLGHLTWFKHNSSP